MDTTATTMATWQQVSDNFTAKMHECINTSTLGPSQEEMVVKRIHLTHH